jgi:hypothetical protein
VGSVSGRHCDRAADGVTQGWHQPVPTSMVAYLSSMVSLIMAGLCSHWPDPYHGTFFEGGEGYWDLNSGPHTCQADVLPLEPLCQACFVLDVFEIGSWE